MAEPVGTARPRASSAPPVCPAGEWSRQACQEGIGGAGPWVPWAEMSRFHLLRGCQFGRRQGGTIASTVPRRAVISDGPAAADLHSGLRLRTSCSARSSANRRLARAWCRVSRGCRRTAAIRVGRRCRVVPREAVSIVLQIVFLHELGLSWRRKQRTSGPRDRRPTPAGPPHPGAAGRGEVKESCTPRPAKLLPAARSPQEVSIPNAVPYPLSAPAAVAALRSPAGSPTAPPADAAPPLVPLCAYLAQVPDQRRRRGRRRWWPCWPG